MSFMPSNEVVLIDRFINEAQAARSAPIPDDIAFELFAAQSVLRDRNLSDEEIEAGRIGGGKDGGIDAVYVFLDEVLLDEDSDVYASDFQPRGVRTNAVLELWLVQAKREQSFSETAIDKAASSLKRLLDLNLTDEDLQILYSKDLVARMRLFTNAWTILGVRSPQITIRFDYVTKGATATAGPPVIQKERDLEAMLISEVPGATAEARLVGALELWTIASSMPEYKLQLKFEDYVSKGDSYTGLVSLAEYFDFLSDADGNLQSHLFDWNVRDFQGGVAVNRDIQATLETPNEEDFWWLNNGVTILCSFVNIGGSKTFTMADVQIVNGMQTSHGIHSAISRIGVDAERLRNRSVLVRVFKTQDEEMRDRIIRATNSQTKVPDASLHATENIHRQIESRFLSDGWYYDRRKNFYKNNGKPSDRIIGISTLGQAVMAMGLSRPNDARARPSTLLNNPVDYKAIFSTHIPLDTYLWFAVVQKTVDGLLITPAVSADPYFRSNFRFYVSTYLVTKAFGSKVYNPGQLSDLSSTPLIISPEQTKDALNRILELAIEISDREEWPIDRVAKSKQFAEAVINLALGIEPSADESSNGEDDADDDHEDNGLDDDSGFGPSSNFSHAMAAD